MIALFFMELLKRNWPRAKMAPPPGPNRVKVNFRRKKLIVFIFFSIKNYYH